MQKYSRFHNHLRFGMEGALSSNDVRGTTARELKEGRYETEDQSIFLTSALAIGLVSGAHAVPTMSLMVFEGVPGSTVLVAGPTAPTSSGSLEFNSSTIPDFSLVQASVAGFPIIPQADSSVGSFQVTTGTFTGTREFEIFITQDNLDAISIPTDFQMSTQPTSLSGRHIY